jgi:hypothetical protein
VFRPLEGDSRALRLWRRGCVIGTGLSAAWIAGSLALGGTTPDMAFAYHARKRLKSEVETAAAGLEAPRPRAEGGAPPPPPPASPRRVADPAA